MLKLFAKRGRIKLYVFVFYFLTGLLPLILLSYYYLENYAESLKSELNNNVEISINEISSSIEERLISIKKTVFAMSQLTTLKAGMTEYLTPLKRESIEKRLNELSDYFGFDYYEVLRNDNSILFSSLQNYSNDFLVFEEIINDYSGKILGRFRAFVSFEKVFGNFLKYNTEKYDYSKKIYYRGKLIFDDKKDIKNPIEFIGKKESSEFKLIFQVSRDSIRKRLLMNIQNTAVLIFLLVLLAIVISVYFLEWLTRPFGSLIAGFAEVSDGNFNYRIKKHHSKDIDFVYEQFNKMAENLSETQDKLIQAEKLSSLGLMSAGIAHEIKNPLASIKMALEQLKKVDESKVQYLSDIIEEEIERVNRFVAELLNFAKPSGPAMEKINIKNEVKECIKLLSFQFRKANVSINEDLADYICFADKNHFHQIVINVLINALQACNNDNAMITVKSEILSECYVLMISDNGKGIPKEVQDKIFDPFFTTKKGGTGLGLSVVYSLCKKNNIDLEIKSKDNEGTTVILKFKR